MIDADRLVEDAPDWLKEEADRLNRTHFGGELAFETVVSRLQRGIAMTTPQDGFVFVFVDPRVLDQDRQWASDTLLHEMIHVLLLAENDDGDRRHGERFVTAANRIGAQLGLPNVLSESRQAQDWPQSVRGERYPAWIGGASPLIRTPPDGPPGPDDELVVVLPAKGEDGLG